MSNSPAVQELLAEYNVDAGRMSVKDPMGVLLLSAIKSVEKTEHSLAEQTRELLANLDTIGQAVGEGIDAPTAVHVPQLSANIVSAVAQRSEALRNLRRALRAVAKRTN